MNNIQKQKTIEHFQEYWHWYLIGIVSLAYIKIIISVLESPRTKEWLAESVTTMTKGDIVFLIIIAALFGLLGSRRK